MFTIKHVSPSGNEALYQAIDVQFLPGVAPDTGMVSYKTAAGPELHGLEGGTVYVMNEAGKTVATYRMADPKEAGLYGHQMTTNERAQYDAQDEFNRRKAGGGDQVRY